MALPAGFAPRPPGEQGAGVIVVEVGLEIEPGGKILRSAIVSPSGEGALDKALIAALDRAGCMPAPPTAMLDPRSKTFRAVQPYAFVKTR